MAEPTVEDLLSSSAVQSFSAPQRLSGDNQWLLWQLADSAFPTGGFAHSGGLEAAWQNGEVSNRGDVPLQERQNRVINRGFGGDGSGEVIDFLFELSNVISS